MDERERRRLGAWYTPEPLVDHLVRAAVPASVHGCDVDVLDPACGDGRFLLAVAARVRDLGGRPRLLGVDVDREAVATTRRALVGEAAMVIADDALARDWGDARFDLVIGNPPFKGQLSALTTRGGRSRHGGGPYADAAAEFLALSSRLVRDGGRVGLVLPLSLLGARDAGPVRDTVQEVAALRWAWWSDRSVFPDAEVRTCALVLERGAEPGPVARCTGPDFEPLPDVAAPARWTELVAHGQGVPDLPGPLAVAGTVGDHAAVTADFREQYYGLVGAVGDDVDGPPLVTSGVIDPGRCRWGERTVRFAGTRYRAPRVDLGALSPKLQRWAAARLVPKVLIASQTRVIEAVADPDGAWLPGVPVVTAATAEPWAVAAVLTSPVASVVLARGAAGTGLSARSVRVRAADVAALPWPAGSLDDAVEALRSGDVLACGTAVTRAFGLDPDGDGAPVTAWWTTALPPPP